MKKIIFASNNADKVSEVKAILKDTGICLLSLKEAGIFLDVEETGNTFEENAILKARAVTELTGCAAAADDSGLCVDYLNGQPGVYSARFLGEDTSYLVKNQYIIDQLKEAEEHQRGARFICVFAFSMPDGRIVTKSGTIEGRIAYQPAGEYGFGYDPIFYLPQYGKTTAQMLPEEKHKLSHRGRALEALKEDLKAYSLSGKAVADA